MCCEEAVAFFFLVAVVPETYAGTREGTDHAASKIAVKIEEQRRTRNSQFPTKPEHRAGEANEATRTAELLKRFTIDGFAPLRRFVEGKVLDACPTLYDKVHFLNALLLQPPTDQQREWTEAFGLAWRWTDILYNSEFKVEVIRTGHEDSVMDRDERTIES